MTDLVREGAVAVAAAVEEEEEEAAAVAGDIGKNHYFSEINLYLDTRLSY